MNREILFRGKDSTGIMNHNWFYGSLDTSFNEDFPRIICKDKWGNTMLITVDCETVGQYTGLTDKNGTKIFEGDIVNCRVLRLSANHSSWSQETNKEHGKCRILPMEIYFIEPYTDYNYRFGGIGFRLTQKAKELIEEYEKPVGKETTNQLINWFNIDKEDLIEVIGNIYDNPELIGGEDESNND